MSVPARAAIVPASAAGALLLAAGCHSYLEVGYFESETRVVSDPRVLAIRTAVMDKAMALPFETVELTPLIVDGGGVVDTEELDVLWLACELDEAHFSSECLARTLPLTLAEIPACPVQDPDQLEGDALPEAVGPCVIGREGAPEYVVPLTTGMLDGWLDWGGLTGIELTMIAGAPGGISTDECAAEILHGEGDTPDDCLHFDKILHVGPFDSFLALVADLGVEIPGVDVDASVPDGFSEPVHNPRISEFRVTVVEGGQPTGDPMILERGEVIQVPLGALLDIEVDSDYATSDNWYRTWGQLSVLAAYSMGQNHWRLTPDDQDPTTAPSHGRAWLYHVVYNGWIGVDWFWFGVETPA